MSINDDIYDIYFDKIRYAVEDYCIINNLKPWDVDINPVYNYSSEILAVNVKSNTSKPNFYLNTIKGL